MNGLPLRGIVTADLGIEFDLAEVRTVLAQTHFRSDQPHDVRPVGLRTQRAHLELDALSRPHALAVGVSHDRGLDAHDSAPGSAPNISSQRRRNTKYSASSMVVKTCSGKVFVVRGKVSLKRASVHSE